MREFGGYRKGINLGGWLSQYAADSAQHRDTFITEDDIEAIAAAGLDHVRLPVDYEIIENEDGTPRGEGLAYIDKCIEWCRKRGLLIVLDLHKAYGYSFDPSKKEDKTVFFRDEICRQRFYRTWSQLAKRYGGYSDMVAFELLNEVVPRDVASEWNEIALITIEEIRKFAPDTWIVIGGVMYNSIRAIPMLPVVSDRKVAYNFHCYDPMVFTHQGASWMDEVPNDLRVGYPKPLSYFREQSDKIAPDFGGDISDPKIPECEGAELFDHIFAEAVKTATERDVPLYCGEYGVIEYASAQDTLNWYKDIHAVFEKYDIARACWTYKSMCFGVMDERLRDMRSELKNCF